ncbi:hypothetical protein BH20ACT7_BH20ACT7_17430 [soil metagenome]
MRASGPSTAGTLRTIGVLIVGLLLGVGIASWIARPRAPQTDPVSSASVLPSAPETSRAGGSGTGDAKAEPPPPAVAARARDAVTGFLEAEVAGDFVASYGFLSAQDQETFGGREGWIAAHADLPPIKGFELKGLRAVDGGVRATTALRLRSTLDEFVGLIPARANATWTARPESDGWRVAYTEGAIKGLYPSDDAAVDAASAWVTDRLACEKADQHPGGLLGDSDIAESLCGLDGEFSAGEMEPLTDVTDGQPFIAAYGAEALAQMRSVAFDGPTPMRVVVAPVADRWTVVGVLETRP